MGCKVTKSRIDERARMTTSDYIIFCRTMTETGYVGRSVSLWSGIDYRDISSLDRRFYTNFSDSNPM